MSSQIPPSPYFSGINFNSGFFSSITDYLTEAIANSKYLKLLGGNLRGFLGILRNPARVALDVNGKAVINDNTSGTPQNAELGGTGTRIILREGTAIQTPFALGVVLDTLWYGTSSIGTHMFYTGTNSRMFIDNNGSVGIGTPSATSANTKLSIRGSSTGSSQPLVNIIQTNAWDGNYALQVEGYTNLKGLVNVDLSTRGLPGIGTFGSGGGNRLILYPGDVSNYPYGLGVAPDVLWYSCPATKRHEFYVGATRTLYMNETGIQTPNNVTINGASGSSLQLHITAATTTEEAAMKFSGPGSIQFFIGMGGTAIANTLTRSNAYFITSGSMIFMTNNRTTSANILINSNGYVGIETNTADNVFQVGSGQRLRISNGSTDYTRIGVLEAGGVNNSCIVLSGHQRSAQTGNIEYSAVNEHIFYSTNTGSFIDNVRINPNDFIINTSCSTYGANYYTDGEYLVSMGRTNTAGTLKTGYFISNEWFYNSLVMLAVSHNDATYTYWHGYYGTNNSTATMYITALNQSNMTVEAFQEQTTLKYYLFLRPSIPFNQSVQMRIKFYG